MDRKKIREESSRLATYAKRRAELFKEARELSILCGCEVAVILFSADGRVDHHCSSDLKEVITRYKNRKVRHTSADKPEEPNIQVDFLRQDTQIQDIKKLLGTDLTGMNLQELRALMQKLDEGLLYINDRKEQIMQNRRQTLHSALEAESSSRQVEGFQSRFDIHPRTTSSVKPADKESDTALSSGHPPSGG